MVFLLFNLIKVLVHLIICKRQTNIFYFFHLLVLLKCVFLQERKHQKRNQHRILFFYIDVYRSKKISGNHYICQLSQNFNK